MAKQFNLNGNNGLYLTYRPTTSVNNTNYLTEFLVDNNFFPNTINDSLTYIFNNSYYNDPGQVMGSNSLASSNTSLQYTQITNPNKLILNEVYYNTFIFYFNFNGSNLFGYTPGNGISGTDFSAYLNRLRVKLYVEFGTNIIPLTLTNLQCWINTGSTTGVYRTISGNTYYNTTLLQGFRLNTGLNNESCIDLGYGSGAVSIDSGYTTYGQYFTNANNPNYGYTFRVTATSPNFTGTTTNNKDYNLVIKYYNIGATGTTLTYPYNTSEAVELMANTYPWYQLIETEPVDEVGETFVSIGGLKSSDSGSSDSVKLTSGSSHSGGSSGGSTSFSL